MKFVPLGNIFWPINEESIVQIIIRNTSGNVYKEANVEIWDKHLKVVWPINIEIEEEMGRGLL